MKTKGNMKITKTVGKVALTALTIGALAVLAIWHSGKESTTAENRTYLSKAKVAQSAKSAVKQQTAADKVAGAGAKATEQTTVDKNASASASVAAAANAGVVADPGTVAGSPVSASARTAALSPSGCPSDWPEPTKGMLIGEVVDYRTVRLPPTEKGGQWGELREWLTDRGEGYPNHLEEEYRPDEKGEMVLVNSRQYAAHQVMVTVDPEVSMDDFKACLANADASVARSLRFSAKGARLVTVRSNAPATLDTVSALQQSVVDYHSDLRPSVDLVRIANLTPNDAYYSTQWALPKISAPSAWGERTDASSVIVAVLDSGINYRHVDLSGNMWHNPQPSAVLRALFEDNSININDEYGIRCIDDTISGDPMDDVGHGSHCAGIIGAVGNNGTGVCGAAWRVKLMACKWMFPYQGSGVGYGSDEYFVMLYAWLSGAKICSCSFGFNGSDPTEGNIIETLREDGVIFVCSAGNDGTNNDTVPSYPASHPSDNIVSVAATDQDDDLCTRAKNGWSGGSNYGANSVDIAAPGHNIRSTINGSTTAYEYYNGTSMAAPYVSGALALIKAQFPNETYLQTIQRLYNGGDSISKLSGKVKTGKRLNLYKPLQSGVLSAPAGVTASRGTYADRVVVSWNSVNGATHYHVYRSTSSTGSKSSIGSWQTSTSYTDSSVTPGTTYYYWVTAAKSSSGSGESGYSSSASGYPQPTVRDSWDPGDDTASGGTTITPSTSVQTHGAHTLSSSDNYDFFKISLSVGRTYTFESSGTGDTYGELYSSTTISDSNRVAYNDDGAGSSQFKIVYAPTRSGTYYLRVRCYSTGSSASYSLKYSATAPTGDSWDPGDDTASGGTTITPSTSWQTHGAHTLTSTDLYDFFKVSMTVGRKYTFESTNLTGDDVAELFNSTSTNAANRVAYNDDGTGIGLNFRIEYTPTTSGTYYLRVRTCGGAGGSATYTLKYKYETAASKDIVFCSFTDYKNWPSGVGAFISASTNDLSHPITQFTTEDTVYLYHGWSELNDQVCSESVSSFITLTRQNSTNVISWCEMSWQGGLAAGLTGNPWDLSGLPAGAYTATFRLNEDRNGRRTVVESDYANNVRTVNFTVVAPAKTLSSIAINGNASVISKGTATYRCVATYTDGTTSPVTPEWSITSGAAYATISESGLLTAAEVTSEQRVTITAAYGGKTATKQVTIQPEVVDIGSHFGDVVVYPTAPMVVEARVTINGEPAEEGDELAAFSGDEVRGVANVVAGGRATMAVYVSTANEPITFRVYDASEGDEGAFYPCIQSVQGNPGATQGTAAAPIPLDAASNDPFGEVEIEPTAPTILEAQITIDGVAAAAGDVLGVFCGEKLVGKQVVSYGAQTTGDGRSGEPIAYCSAVLFVNGTQTLTFKVWDASEQLLLDVPETLRVSGGDVIGSQNSRYLIEAVTFNEDNTPCEVRLSSSGWNLVSFSVLPPTATPSAVFDPVRSSIRYVTSGTSIWSPTSNGNLTQISIGNGYWVNRSSASAVSWTVEGTGAPDMEIRLVEGWNLVGYTLPRAGSVQNVLATALATGKIDYIVSGKQLYPNGGLTTMAPGVGYWVRATGSYTLKFDRSGMMSAAASAAAISALSADMYGPFGSDVTISPGVPTILADISFAAFGKPLAVGDCVALYDKDDGKLYSVSRIEDESSKLTMTLFANAGKNMHFRIWNSASGLDDPEIFDADASCDFVSPTQGEEIVGKAITVSGTAPTYTVTYDLDGKGSRTGGGALTQTVAFDGAPVDPEVVASSGNTFREWDHSKRTNIRGNVMFTALYDSVEGRYTVVFNAHGGTGTMAPASLAYGTSATLPLNAFTCSGHDFAGWSREPGGAVAYQDGASVLNLAAEGGSVTLYAVWTPLTSPVDQSLSISGAGWHEVSFCALPTGGSPDDVFEAVADKIGYVTYGSKNWNPMTGGTLATLEIGKGYWVQTTAETVAWTLTGYANPDVEIELKPGWNLIGYPLLENGDVETVLATALATEKIDFIYSGSRVYPGTLTTLTPGRGYWVYANAAVTIRFDVP